MQKSRVKPWVHILLWGLMIAFLFIAPQVKDRLTITHGKPVAIEGVNLDTPANILSSVDNLEQVKIGDQFLYRMNGWSYINNGKKQTRYTIYLVLRTDEAQYLFTTVPVESVRLRDSYPDVESDLSISGFTADIARDTLRNGTYEIGFLYVDKRDGSMWFGGTDRQLVKTLTRLKLKD